MISEEPEFSVLEQHLVDGSDPVVLTEFYTPIQTSLSVINNALGTLAREGDEMNRVRNEVLRVLEDEVTMGLQTISLWTECAEESIRKGNLSNWMHSQTFQKENKKVMTGVNEIMKKISSDKSENLETLRRTIAPVQEKITIFMSFAEERSQKSLIRIEIDGRISESNIPDLSVSPWQYQERIEGMPPLDTFQTMGSNVFWFETYDGKQNQRCTAKQETGEALNFYVATKAVQQIDETLLQAYVLNEGKWKLFETQCLGGYVVFRAEKAEAFFILGTPKEREFVVGPSGNQYVHKTDERVSLDFPEGSVKETETFKITVFPVKVDEMKKRKAKFPDQYKFLSVSKGIHVKGNAFSKPVQVHLPLEEIENSVETDDDQDFEYVFFRIDGDVVTQLRNQHVEKRNDTVITSVEKFSTYAAAKIRRGSTDSMSSMEALISLGFRYHCKLITFVKKLTEEYVQVWCELVKKEDWKEIEAKRLEEHPTLQKLKDSDSKDIFIAERERLRVDIKGNSFVGTEFPKNLLLITFFPIAEDNHIFPPLRKRGGMHGTPYSTVTYTMDSRSKMSLHTLTFDPWTLPKCTPRRPTTSKGPNKLGPSPKDETVEKLQPLPDSTKTTATASKSRPESAQAQVALSQKTKGYYLKNFENFLEDFEITFIKEKCFDNGIDNLETFLSLDKEDLMNVLGVNLGETIKCKNAQKKFSDLER